MAGPTIGGSSANEALSGFVKSVTFNFNLTAVGGTPSAYTVQPPTIGSDAKLALTDGAGTILTAATFDITVTGVNPVIGLEFKDSNVKANAKLLYALGVVYATTGAANASKGIPVFAGPADLLLVTAGTGMALYLHIGFDTNGAPTTGDPYNKIDQATGVVSFAVTVFYRDY